ncbi:DNA mismatch repair protein MutS [Amanita rubescens]|nr:DNA mismatch repair protein MutS [Amanita rubescens]
MPAPKRKVVSEDERVTDSECQDELENRKRVRWEEAQGFTDGNSEICLTTQCHNGIIGCAYYDPQKCTIYAVEDMQETSKYDVIKMLLEQADASVVLTSSNSDECFIDMLREYADTLGAFFQIRPRKDFLSTKGRDRLLSLGLFAQLPQENVDITSSMDIDADHVEHERNAYDFMRKRRDAIGDPNQNRWNAMIRLSNFTSVDSSPLCMASIGALIDYLVRERAACDLDDEGIASLEVNDIEIIAPTGAMQINADALFSLQVFENERHASLHSDNTKEGLSLFGILNYTRTALGRSLMRTWLLRPLLSLPVIKERHDAVECFTRPENQVPSNSIHAHLKGVKNLPRILSTMKSGRAKLSDWQALVKFTFHSAMIRETLPEFHRAADVRIIQELVSVLDIQRFKDVGTQVPKQIDWEESVNTGRVCVRQNIDEELDNKKHIYYGIDSVLSKVAEQICYTVPHPYATSLNDFSYCIPMLEEWQIEGIPDFEPWSFQFSSEEVVAHAYFKSQEMRDLDVHIGDLHSTIADREIEIVQELLNDILLSSEAITRACEACAELDCLLSFAAASRAYNYVRPVMVDDNVIDIKQGRHPLQEQVVDTFVANDFFIVGGVGSNIANVAMDGNERKSAMVCTGANACGKSVYFETGFLKSICQYVASYHYRLLSSKFMGQIGCFVPANSATLGVVDKIFTRVSTRESVSKIQSAFMIDLNQVSYALRNCTARSLILLDDVLECLIQMEPVYSAAFLYIFSLVEWTAPNELISTHELGKLLDEEMTEEERLDLEDAEGVCRQFLAWDLDDKRGLGEGGVRTKLAEVLGRNSHDMNM